MFGVSVVTEVAVLGWFLAILNPRKNPVSFEIALIMSLFLGFFIVFGVPWMNRISPSKIKFTDKKLIRLRGNRVLHIKWSAVESFHFTANKECAILQLKTSKQDELKIGLDPSISINDLKGFLIEVGLELSK